MQRTSLSLLRSYAGGAFSLEASLQRAAAVSSLINGAGSCSALPTPAVRPSLLSCLKISESCFSKGVRFAGDYKPDVPGNTIDNWSALRASFDTEQPNSLGGNYYLNVLVMGFAYWLNDAYYFPPRTAYIGALIFFCLYVRKGFFSTPLAHKHDY
ncbi:hypothetical protein PLESTB_000037300 [Pleodorina starrii]|uniref:Uncharacterized protein n=1 Tax=Pleodorina starrii TaxID=330485 RepID=A0A9W6EX49_9CHLO|nr:hypothetical protein PLESTM_001096000 [Pleodorina starrii]GLC47895.1 hypothetical protein PLESTB_000037300 [Pleodorina starrii]GLC70673.1 hypothetical protein PLESTF_001020400 [Pleodorina starrii]